jgi:hypothetical protein
MTTESSPVPPLCGGQLRSAFEWQAAAVVTLLQAQQRQAQVLLTWHKSMAAISQDLWDRWVCRFGGGVPLDG